MSDNYLENFELKGKRLKIRDAEAIQLISNITNKLANFEGALKEINDAIQNHNSDIADIVNRIGSIDASITGLDGDVANINSNIESINTSVTELDGDIASINSNIESINTSVTELDGDIVSINSNIESINTSVTELDGDIASINNDINNIEATLDTTAKIGESVNSITPYTVTGVRINSLTETLIFEHILVIECEFVITEAPSNWVVIGVSNYTPQTENVNTITSWNTGNIGARLRIATNGNISLRYGATGSYRGFVITYV